MNKYLQPAAIMVLLFVLSPVPLMYFSYSRTTSFWCWTWIGLFAWFTFAKAGHETRAIGLIVGSVFIAIIGRSYLKGKESDDILEAISQVILIIGGGVGGNFLAHAMLKGHGSGEARRKK